MEWKRLPYPVQRQQQTLNERQDKVMSLWQGVVSWHVAQMFCQGVAIRLFGLVHGKDPLSTAGPGRQLIATTRKLGNEVVGSID